MHEGAGRASAARITDPQGQVTFPALPAGAPLGLGMGITFEAVELELPEGSTLAFYTDVLVETRDKARASLRQADTIQPPSGVTRTVVALADACEDEHLVLAAEFDPDNALIPLRRVTLEGISSWATDVEALAPFAETEARNRLMDASGRWPILLDAALAQARQGRRVPTICNGRHALRQTRGPIRSDRPRRCHQRVAVTCGRRAVGALLPCLSVPLGTMRA